MSFKKKYRLRSPRLEVISTLRRIYKNTIDLRGSLGRLHVPWLAGGLQNFYWGHEV